ncbi:MAG: two-component system, OmpR family, sensor kinase [Pseudonocardiales bacterium]|jgi:two-component system OmpR family sensor kinase|nr:two-component system, OmpR family, sensor kinase [Pseudonocardiales bacterium]
MRRRVRGGSSPRTLSLRTRLLVATIGLAAIGIAATGITASVLLRHYLVQRVDQQLGVGLRALLRQSTDGTRPPLKAGSPGQLPTPYIFTQIDTHGAIQRQFGGSLESGDPRPDVSKLDTAAVVAHHSSPFTVQAVSGSDSFRIIAVERSDHSGADTAAISLHSVNSTVHRLELVIGSVSALVLVLLAALGTLAVRLGLRPLADVEHTAHRIAEGDLSQRVSGGRPGTEIGRLATSLNTMLSQIEAAFTDRAATEATLRRFVADASHELRTPLTTIRGYAELFRQGAVTDQAAHLRATSRIEAEATRMGRLVDDLLLLAELDQPARPHLAPIGSADLATLVSDAVADARAADPERDIGYDGPASGVRVPVDGDRLRQVLANLTTNARVHTPSGTPVTVTLTSTPSTARLEVSDRGPGIAADDVSRIFERFYRTDTSRSRARGGTGLGLAIVHAVVAAAGGTVTCESIVGVGTTFAVELPVSPAEPRPQP